MSGIEKVLFESVPEKRATWKTRCQITHRETAVVHAEAEQAVAQVAHHQNLYVYFCDYDYYTRL